ncbi:MAG TPA: hypothetical protein VGS14_09305 [Actinomycetes bacterium]|jgi:hypothetical protein|nr:hypothetical protein [Actinomycetes bacterium]
MSTMEPDEGAQPDDQQADAPRWESTEAADATDAPRWEGAAGTDAPRWEGAEADAEAADSDDPDSTDQ